MKVNISLNTVLSALFVIAPQFYTVDPTILAGYAVLFNLISCQVNGQILACCGVMAYAFLMAHYLTIAANSSIGVNNNIHEGDLSLGYNVSPDMNALDLTPYGRSYQDLIDRTIVGTFVTNLPPILGGVIQPFPMQGCGYGYGGWGIGGAGYGGGCCG
jgi:hypothetical protein